jgi:hypothetical protein
VSSPVLTKARADISQSGGSCWIEVVSFNQRATEVLPLLSSRYTLRDPG